MNGKNAMEEVSVVELMDRYSLIVPEIQREYVWGLNKNDILNTFINDIKNGVAQNDIKIENYKPTLDVLQSQYDSVNDDNVKRIYQKAIDDLRDNLTSLNIGFLYSYKPNYYVFNDRNEDIYLIDGQQRFTTLFLMLFYFAIKEERREEFVELFRFNEEKEQIAFDYRVRTLTHNFFIDLINKTQNLEDLDELTSNNWFLSNYKNDVTVKSIVGDTAKKEINGLFPVLNHHFKNDENKYFDFLKGQVKFWHFKTEETSQGEELYITMNSRGQQLADNETIRAKLFEPEEIKRTGKLEIYWSEQWENWQDFFWKNRNKGLKGESSADVGFNEFLRWVQIIKMTENQTQIIDNEDENALDKKEIVDTIKWEGNKKLNITFLSLDEIELYFLALNYLYADFNKKLSAEKSKYKVYDKFYLVDIGWLSPSEGAISQLDCFKFLPILHYCKNRLQRNENIEPLTLFRLIRFLYNLSKNKTIAKTASVQCIHALKMIDKLKANDDVINLLNKKGVSISILNKEEKLKLNIIKSAKDRIKTEDWFWMAEDIEVNKGEISHLIELTKQIKKEETSFNNNIFVKVVLAYQSLIEKKDNILGDLLDSNVYFERNNRAEFKEDYHKQLDFLTLTHNWYKFKVKNLDDFLIKKRKEFVKKYSSSEEIENETSIKKQLYIYYILQINILSPPQIWNWRGEYNFGGIGNYPSVKSIFHNGLIFQQYKTYWRLNDGKILSIQKNLKNKAKKIEELLTWSKQ